MINLVIYGALGRMGLSLADEASSDSSFSIHGAVEAPAHPGIGKVLHGAVVTSDLEGSLEGAGVLVDFTDPGSSIKALRACASKGIPAVSGTTGFTARESEEIGELSRDIPILVSPNMSAGANLMMRLAEEAAAAPVDYEIEISEAHHRNKIDSPSGTAARLAEKIIEVRGRGFTVQGRVGSAGPRKEGEIGVHSLRGGDVIGEHRVMFMRDGEILEISHRALSRKAFALGALEACRYIVKRENGLYSMEDVFKA